MLARTLAVGALLVGGGAWMAFPSLPVAEPGPTLGVVLAADSQSATVTFHRAKSKTPITGYTLLALQDGEQLVRRPLGPNDTVTRITVPPPPPGKLSRYRVQVQTVSDTLRSAWTAYEWTRQGEGTPVLSGPLDVAVRLGIPTTSWTASGLDSVAIYLAQYQPTDSLPGPALFAAMLAPGDSVVTLAGIVPGKRYALYAAPFVANREGTREFFTTFIMEQ